MKILDKMLLGLKAKRVRHDNPNPIKEWPVYVVSKDMGCERGKTATRWYVDEFIRENCRYIKGDVIEIGDNSYTREFGKGVEHSYILTADTTKTEAFKATIIHGDLQNGVGCKSNMADCFILTQTLMFIYDIKSAVKNIVDMLKPGGVALITVSGISMISRYDDSRWGHYWGFTETSLRKLFEDIVQKEQMEIVSMGNPKTAAACLYGLSIDDLSKEDLNVKDELVPVVIGMIVKKV